MKECKICFKVKDLTEFHTRSARCKLCHNEYTREHYQNNKEYYKAKAAARDKVVVAENQQKLLEFLRLNPCIDCGNDDLEVLEFDHLDPATKKYNVSEMLAFPWKTIQLEIDKCVIMCSNCHTKKTRRQFGWWLRD